MSTEKPQSVTPVEKFTPEQMKAPIASGTSVQKLFEAYKQAFVIAAPKHLDVNRMMRIALTEVSRNQKLLECTAGSLLAAFMTAVQLGLEISVLGQAYLVPFKNEKSGRREVQLIPGYRGLVQLARRSGEISNIYAAVVYKEDIFEYELGLTPKLVHKPKLDGEEKLADIIAAYTVAHFKDGGSHVGVMSRHRLDLIKGRSKAKDSGPWKTDAEEMFKKSVIRRESKLWPMSIELSMAVTLDDRAASGVAQNINLIENGGEMPTIVIATDDDDLSNAAIPRLNETQRNKVKAWLDKHKWPVADSVDMLSVELKDDPHEEKDLLNLIGMVREEEFETMLKLIEAGPKKYKEQAQTRASEKKPEVESVITDDQYDDLWAFVSETKTRREAVAAFIKTLGIGKLREVKAKDYAAVWELARKTE